MAAFSIKSFAYRHRAAIYSMLGGAFFALGSPPTNVYVGIIIGLVFLSLSLSHATKGYHSFGLGVLWATTCQLIGLRFVPDVIVRFTDLGIFLGYLALFLLSLAQSIVWGIGAWVGYSLHKYTRLPKEVSFAASIFTAVSLPTIFYWTPAGLLTPWPSLVQLADILGERGVSALFALAAAMIAHGHSSQREGARSFASLRMTSVPRMTSKSFKMPKRSLIGLLIFPALALYGHVRMRQFESSESSNLHIALINQSVEARERWEPGKQAAILKKLHKLTERAETDGADLTIWPEAAYPYTLDHESLAAPKGSKNVFTKNILMPILFGVITHNSRTNESFNSTSVAIPGHDKIHPTADKLQLLWFGETVPLSETFPWLRKLFQRSGGLFPGTHPTTLQIPLGDFPKELSIGVLNCYEDTLPSVGRRVMNHENPALLVNVTNDAWFAGSAESLLHARLGTMRAIENRRDLVRAVNRGVSTWVSASGKIAKTYDDESPGILMTTPTLRTSQTIYCRWGDVPMWLLFGLCAVISAKIKRA